MAMLEVDLVARMAVACLVVVMVMVAAMAEMALAVVME